MTMHPQELPCRWLPRSAVIAVALLSLSTGPTSADQIATFVAPEPGMVMIYEKELQLRGRDGRVVGSKERLEYTVLPDRTLFEGVPAYRIRQHRSFREKNGSMFSRTTISVKRLEDGNTIAGIGVDHRYRARLTPHNGRFSWPMSVGTNWTSEYTLNFVKGGPTFRYTWSKRVVAQTEITVPAGTFSTFRIEGERGGNVKSTTWYAPELGIIIKQIGTSKRLGHVVRQTMTLRTLKRP